MSRDRRSSHWPTRSPAWLRSAPNRGCRARASDGSASAGWGRCSRPCRRLHQPRECGSRPARGVARHRRPWRDRTRRSSRRRLAASGMSFARLALTSPVRFEHAYSWNFRAALEGRSGSKEMRMKLVATMMLTVDGVYQGPGGPDEDRRGGFERGGWTSPYADEEGWRILTSNFERADALLLGRKTWEIWEPYWPKHDAGDPVSHGINVLPKYVPSTTLKDPTWQNTHVISGDVEAAVRELKAKPGREIQVHGSGELLRWLLERDLVDELNLRIYPVVVGDGLRLFPERGQTHNLELVETRSTATGVMLQTYRLAGRATFGTAGD